MRKFKSLIAAALLAIIGMTLVPNDAKALELIPDFSELWHPWPACFGGPFFSGDEACHVPFAVPIDNASPVSPPATYNKKDFWRQTVKMFLAFSLRNVVERYVSSYINQILDKYKIKDYYNYAMNVKNEVYALKAMRGADDFHKQVLINIIRDLDGNPIGRFRIPDWSRQLAMADYGNLFSNPPVFNSEAEVYMFLSQAGNMRSQPMGQKSLAIMDAMKIHTDAYNATYANISQGGSNKDRYVCPPDPSGQEQVDCLVNDPGKFITQHIESRLNALFKTKTELPESVGGTASAIAEVASGLIFGSGLLGSNPPSQRTIEDLARDLGQ